MTSLEIFAIGLIIAVLAIVIFISTRGNLPKKSDEGMQLSSFDKLAKILDITNRAIDRLRNGQPTPDATQQDDPNEAYFLHYLKETYYQPARQRGRQFCESTKDSLEGIYTEIKHFVDRNLIGNISNRIRTGYSDILDRNQERVRRKFQDKVRTERGYTAFYKKHKLDRDPEYPGSKTFLLSTILCLLLIESVLNSYFFARGSDFGLLGGLWEATLISGLNIFFAFLFGNYAVRYFWHHDRSWKLRAGFFLCAYILMIIFFNLLVAHYRVALGLVSLGEIELLNAKRKVIELFLADPFAIKNFDAIVLFLIGVSISIGAAIKFLTSDDVYPGFGKKHRRREEARKEYAEQLTSLQKELRDLLERGEQQLLNDCKQIKEQIKDCYAKHTLFIQRLEEFENNTDKLRELYQLLVKSYRQVIRDQHQEFQLTQLPGYFDDPPPDPDWSKDIFENNQEGIKEKLQSQREQISEKLEPEITKLLHEIHTNFEKLRTELQAKRTEFEKQIEQQVLRGMSENHQVLQPDQ